METGRNKTENQNKTEKPIPVALEWAVDYSPSLFKYWADTDRDGLIDFINYKNKEWLDSLV